MMDESIDEVVIPVNPVTTETVVGKTRRFSSLHTMEILFLTVSILNLLATVGLTVYRLYVVISSDPKSADFTFCILLLVNAAFCVFYVIHGLVRERIYELYALIAALVAVVIYCVVEYSVNAEGRTTVKLIRLIAACVLVPLNIGLAVAVAREFGFLEFRIVGASAAFQYMYRQAALFSCLLKFDLNVNFSFIVLALQDGTNLSVLEVVTLATGLPYSLLWVIMGWVAMRKELQWLIWVFAVLSILTPAYVIYKIVFIYNQDFTAIQSNLKVIEFASLAVGALSLIVRFVLLCELVVVYRNFGKGLKQRAFGDDSSESTGLLAGLKKERSYNT
ncbi:unnamed protein product [Owenia fusiformis]|uniref:DUF7789 domain-containing protein n=1 Tax=Owenia fusiformis TaxID=6347 RepID=A0A8J1T8C4_OWEFU|nr:unnamed protein product [Owenia fusiformis]